MDTKPIWLNEAESRPNDLIKVSKASLEKRYIKYAVIPERLFFAEPDSNGNFILPAKKILSMEKELIKKMRDEQLLKECAERNNKGNELEKNGQIIEAIKIYEENIKPGCYPAMHSFDRLLVLYRRNLDYKNEMRVCKRAIAVFKGVEKYAIRLEKIQELIGKNESGL